MFRVFQALLLRALNKKNESQNKCSNELNVINPLLKKENEGRWNALIVSLKNMLTKDSSTFIDELGDLFSKNIKEITVDSICKLPNQNAVQAVQAAGGRTKKRRRSKKTKLVRRPQNRVYQRRTSRKRNKN